MIGAVDATVIAPTLADRAYGSLAPAAFELVRLASRACGTPARELQWRVGIMPDAEQPAVWFHGASAGEMAAAVRLAQLLRQHGHRFTAAYTATNRAGLEFVARAGEAEAVTALAPWDHPAWVGRALDQWRPQALVLVETELWPSLILAARRRRIPIFSVSTRIYPRDLGRYRLIRGLTRPMLRRMTAILAQSDVERDRLVELGADPARCFASGNLKHAGVAAAAPDPSPLRGELGLRADESVVTLGSIHRDEVGTVFQALGEPTMPPVRVIVAPRHDAAIATVLRECRRRQWLSHRRTNGPPPANWRVLALDRMGELRHAYAIASVGVVGGGFGRHGGHNPLEPVMVGTPVIYGRHFEHFASEVRALTAAAPAAQVRDANELAQRLARWLSDADERRRVLDLQRGALPDGAAIARRYVAALSPWLDGC